MSGLALAPAPGNEIRVNGLRKKGIQPRSVQEISRKCFKDAESCVQPKVRSQAEISYGPDAVGHRRGCTPVCAIRDCHVRLAISDQGNFII